MAQNSTPEVMRGSVNVFEDLGFDAAEAASLKVRADLMLDLRKFIEDRGWTLEEAESFFGEEPESVRNLIDGEIGRFSIDQLINMLTRAGMRVKVEILPKVA